MAETSITPRPPGLLDIARVWGRVGVLGFGGPPTHVGMLRELCVQRHGWIDEEAYERAFAATSMLPGPASTQLAIYCAWLLRGSAGALVGGVCFIGPGLVMILALAALFLAKAPPSWVRGAAAGSGAAVAAVAVRAGLDLLRPAWERAAADRRPRMAAYAVVGAAASALAGAWVALALVGAGAVEVAVAGRASPTAPPGPRTDPDGRRATALLPLPLGLAGSGGVAGLVWTALKVGALSFGGGFVIVPLMQSDAVSVHHWMSSTQFLAAVALGQLTPGPVVLTVAAVGYAAGGIGAGVLAAAVAFAPSFALVLGAAGRTGELLRSTRARAFLAGAAPAAAGAIVGAAVPLAEALGVWWQGVVLAGAAIALLLMRGRILEVLVAAALIGALGALAGGALPA
jgi:chromate transporter